MASTAPTDTSFTAAARRPAMLSVALVLLGSVLLTLSSYLVIPMVPVPITMQTLAVTSIGALYGWRLGFATVALWLVQGLVGLPVFAGGTAGAAHLVGPTGGYLIAFPFAAAVTGWLVARGWDATDRAKALAAMAVGNLTALTMGAAWLSYAIGPKAAFYAGFAPFIIGALIKSGLGVLVLALAHRLWSRKELA